MRDNLNCTLAMPGHLAIGPARANSPRSPLSAFLLRDLKHSALHFSPCLRLGLPLLAPTMRSRLPKTSFPPINSPNKTAVFLQPLKGVTHVHWYDSVNYPDLDPVGRSSNMGTQPQLGLRTQRRAGTHPGNRIGTGADGANLISSKQHGFQTERLQKKGSDPLKRPEISTLLQGNEGV